MVDLVISGIVEHAFLEAAKKRSKMNALLPSTAVPPDCLAPGADVQLQWLDPYQLLPPDAVIFDPSVLRQPGGEFIGVAFLRRTQHPHPSSNASELSIAADREQMIEFKASNAPSLCAPTVTRRLPGQGTDPKLFRLPLSSSGGAKARANAVMTSHSYVFLTAPLDSFLAMAPHRVTLPRISTWGGPLDTQGCYARDGDVLIFEGEASLSSFRGALANSTSFPHNLVATLQSSATMPGLEGAAESPATGAESLRCERRWSALCNQNALSNCSAFGFSGRGGGTALSTLATVDGPDACMAERTTVTLCFDSAAPPALDVALLSPAVLAEPALQDKNWAFLLRGSMGNASGGETLAALYSLDPFVWCSVDSGLLGHSAKVAACHARRSSTAVARTSAAQAETLRTFGLNYSFARAAALQLPPPTGWSTKLHLNGVSMLPLPLAIASHLVPFNQKLVKLAGLDAVWLGVGHAIIALEFGTASEPAPADSAIPLRSIFANSFLLVGERSGELELVRVSASVPLQDVETVRPA